MTMYYLEADPDPWESIYGTHCTDYSGMRAYTQDLFHAREVAEEHALGEAEGDTYEWDQISYGHVLRDTQDSGADRVHAEIRLISDASDLE